ncbi:hypothetical protein KY284_025753 [Solanum tuberosum]|nr:hypothetical protein KY284_025753 [Solanum tuberosum]
MQAMYIRVKRNKTTYFIQCDPTETILQMKEKLSNLIDQPANDQQLVLMPAGDVLEDSKSLADQKVENDAVVALTLRKGSHPCCICLFPVLVDISLWWDSFLISIRNALLKNHPREILGKSATKADRGVRFKSKLYKVPRKSTNSSTSSIQFCLQQKNKCHDPSPWHILSVLTYRPHGILPWATSSSSPKEAIPYELVVCLIELFIFLYHFDVEFAEGNMCTPSEAWQPRNLPILLCDSPSIMSVTGTI